MLDFSFNSNVTVSSVARVSFCQIAPRSEIRKNLILTVQKFTNWVHTYNRPFPSSKKSHFQSEAKCEAIDMKMIFNYDANKTHFHNKGFALRLVLKVRFFGTRKWPIALLVNFTITQLDAWEFIGLSYLTITVGGNVINGSNENATCHELTIKKD